MPHRTTKRILQLLIAIICFSPLVVRSADKPTDKKSGPASTVDSGTFGILINGKRVASETFHVDQRSDGSSVSSELRFEDASVKAVQNSEMSLQPNGLLKKYVWKEVQPSKSQIVVEPQDEQFMVARIFENGGDTSKDSVHALASGTSILDENFFAHMEVLAWKYMALGCQPDSQGQVSCNWRPLRMPVFIPHQQQSVIAELSYKGPAKAKLNGKDVEYKTFNLILKDPSDFKPEGPDCLLWFNAENKLVRVVIAADNTEVLRD